MRKSIGLKNHSRQLATPCHVIFAYNRGQRCSSLLVWLLGVDNVLCTSCTAGSKGHRLSGSLLWVYVTISIFWGVGLSFHAFNESRPPWPPHTLSGTQFAQIIGANRARKWARSLFNCISVTDGIKINEQNKSIGIEPLYLQTEFEAN